MFFFDTPKEKKCPQKHLLKNKNTKQTNLHLHKNVKKHLKCKMPAKSAGDSITNSSTMLPVGPAAATIIHNISFPCLDINREYLHLIWSFPAGLFFSGFKQFFKMLKCCIKKHKAKESTPGEPGLNLMYEWMNIYLRKQSVSVVDPDRWLSPLTVLPSPPGLRGQKGVEEPGRSRLMSQKGSIVVETPLQGKKEEEEGSSIIMFNY